MKKLETLANIIESVLFVSGKEVAVKDISEKLGVTDKDVLNAAKELQKKYVDKSGIQLLIFNKKLQFCSNPAYAEDVATVLNPIKERELSRSMLEVAAIIAYKQPVTRLDLEEIRRCNSEYAIQNLLKLGVIEIVGRKDAVGRPALFGTTDGFLKRFQISSLEELPDYDELMEKITLLNGGDDNYLFRKDVYDESTDPDAQAAKQGDIFGETAATEGSGDPETADAEEDADEDGDEDIAENAPDDEDVELKSIDEEDVPDFLRDEDVEIIK